MPCSSRIIRKMTPQICYNSNYKLVWLVSWQNVFPVTSLRHQYDITVITVTYYDIIGIEAWQKVYSMLRQIFIDITTWNSFNRQGSKFSFRQTCPAGQVLPKIHSSLRKIYLPCFSGVKMKKTINHCFIDTEAKHVNEYGWTKHLWFNNKR